MPHTKLKKRARQRKKTLKTVFHTTFWQREIENYVPTNIAE
jgi:hypothetical protein